MTTFQRVVKYCAIGFAVFLAVSIISGIVSAILGVMSLIPGSSMGTGNWRHEKTVNYSEDFSGVKSLDMNHTFGNLKVMTGEGFTVKAENVTKNFKASVDNNGKLTISEDGRGFHFLGFNLNGIRDMNARITLTVPVDFTAEKAVLNAGAGNVEIESLKANVLVISAGAGNINGRNMTAQEFNLDGGVGNVTLDNVNFKNAVFDSGVGNLSLNGSLVGNTEINCGVGRVNLNLTGNVNNYNFDVDSGIGAIRLNGEKISGGHLTNDGADNHIKVDGGVGDVNISIKE